MSFGYGIQTSTTWRFILVGMDDLKSTSPPYITKHQMPAIRTFNLDHKIRVNWQDLRHTHRNPTPYIALQLSEFLIFYGLVSSSKIAFAQMCVYMIIVPDRYRIQLILWLLFRLVLLFSFCFFQINWRKDDKNFRIEWSKKVSISFRIDGRVIWIALVSFILCLWFNNDIKLLNI